ncbi:MAG: DedA family protein [Chloroflexi bacterium]|nr:DedA family protein [Chloroflexota bacterium]
MEPLEILANYLDRWGYWAEFFVVMLQNAGVPMPGETVLLAAGWAAGRGLLQLQYVIVFGFVGAALGDNLAYWVGAKGGRPLLLRFGKRFSITEARLATVEVAMLRHSNWVVFLGSFTSVFRVLAGPVAGMIRMPYHRYLLFDSLGVAIWVSGVSVLGYLFGDQWDTLVAVLGRFSTVTAILAVILVAGWLLFRLWRKQQMAAEDKSSV